MKYTYNEDSKDLSNAVAYIDNDGDLRIRVWDQTGAYAISLNGYRACVTDINFKPEDGDRVFYPGDSVTITF